MREVPLVPSQHLVESGKEVAVTKSGITTKLLFSHVSSEKCNSMSIIQDSYQLLMNFLAPCSRSAEMEAHPLGTVKQEAKRPEFFPQPPDHTIGMRRHDPPEIQLPESGEEIAVTKSGTSTTLLFSNVFS